MNYLIFDTETSSLPNPKFSFLNPAQPHIVQLAFVLLDEHFQERASFCSLIDVPASCEIHPKAFEAHGISKDDCKRHGLPIEAALAVMQYALATVNGEVLRVAHNFPFDNSLYNIECARTLGELWDGNVNDHPNMEYVPHKQHICTMRLLTPLCQIPHKNGRMMYGSKWKWPTLQEAHSVILGEGFDGAHDALADVRATARLFRWLVEHQHIPLPKAAVTSPELGGPDIGAVSSSHVSEPLCNHHDIDGNEAEMNRFSTLPTEQV